MTSKGADGRRSADGFELLAAVMGNPAGVNTPSLAAGEDELDSQAQNLHTEDRRRGEGILMKWIRYGPLLLVCVLVSAACRGRETSSEPMRTECFGRHEISMPESFRFQHSGSSATFYYGHEADFETVEVQVVDSGVEPTRFAASVASRAADVSADSNERTRGSMLLMHEEIGSGTFLLRYHRSDVSDRSHVHEIHRLVSGEHLFLKAESFKGEMAPVEARLKDLAAGARASSSSAGLAAGDGGFCLGSLWLDPADDYESATFLYRSMARSHRDLTLGIGVGTFKRDETTPRVAQRLDGNFSGLGFLPGVLRKGAAELGGVSAEQWLGRERVGGLVEHLFVVESYPASPGLRNPTLQVEFRTGGLLPSQPATGLPPYRRSSMPPLVENERVGSSLSDDQAIALWDEMVQSIRVR